MSGNLPISTQNTHDLSVGHSNKISIMDIFARQNEQSPGSQPVAKIASMARNSVKSSELKTQIAARLKAARMAYDENGAAVARAIGIERPRLQKYEDGSTYPDEMFIVKFAQLTGCPTDWIYLGRITAEMPATMAARIAVLAPELVSGVSSGSVKAEAELRSRGPQPV